MDRATLPRRHAHRLRRPSPPLRRAAQRLPEFAELPAPGRRAGRQARRTLRRQRPSDRLAHLQRARRPLLLRQLRRRLPRLARTQVRFDRGVEPRVERELLEPHLRRFRPDPTAERDQRRTGRRARHSVRLQHRLQAVPVRLAAGHLRHRARRDPRVRRDASDHHEPHGHLRGCRLFPLGARDGRDQLGRLSVPAHHAFRQCVQARSDARRGRRQAVHAHGVDAEPDELAGVQRTARARADACGKLSGGRAWRGYRAVFPAQAVARRVREVPWRGDLARRARGRARVRRGACARRRAGGARRAVRGRSDRGAGRADVRLGFVLVDRKHLVAAEGLRLSGSGAALVCAVPPPQHRGGCGAGRH